MLRLAIVGAGWAGEHHVLGAREIPEEVEVACLVDSDAGFLAAKSRELGVEATHADLAAALADPDIDAVSLCTPHALHCPQALEVAAAGKHVLVEKPMALSVAEATRMLAAAEANGVRLYVAESATYAPVAQFLRGVVREGRWIGELTGASVTSGFRGPNYGYPGRRAWLGDPGQGGTGSWTLHGIHTVAQMRYVLGEVGSVYAREHKAASFERDDVEATVSALLELEAGLAVQLVQTAETRLYHDLGGYVLHGDRGSVRAGETACHVFTDEEDGTEVAYPEASLSGFALELQAFAEYVAGTSEGFTTGSSERRSLAVIEAGYESMRSGRPVDLRERFGEL